MQPQHADRLGGEVKLSIPMSLQWLYQSWCWNWSSLNTLLMSFGWPLKFIHCKLPCLVPLVGGASCTSGSCWCGWLGWRLGPANHRVTQHGFWPMESWRNPQESGWLGGFKDLLAEFVDFLERLRELFFLNTFIHNMGRVPTFLQYFWAGF